MVAKSGDSRFKNAKQNAKTFSDSSEVVTPTLIVETPGRFPKPMAYDPPHKRCRKTLVETFAKPTGANTGPFPEYVLAP